MRLALGAILLLLVAIVIGVAGGCGNDGVVDDATAPTAPAASPTAGANSTPAASPGCPFDEELCQFAADLSGWIADGNAPVVLDHSAAIEVTCSGTPPGAGVDPTFPLCSGAAPGEVRAGYPIGRLQSESATFPAMMVAQALESRFGNDYPTRGLQLASVGCPIAQPGERPSCDASFGLVFRAPPGVEPQSLLQISIVRAPSGPLVRRYYSGEIALNAEMIEGGTSTLTLVEPENSTGTQYTPITVPAE